MKILTSKSFPRLLVFSLSLLLSALLIRGATAESYTLKSGKVFSGKILYQDNQQIKLETSDGIVFIPLKMLADLGPDSSIFRPASSQVQRDQAAKKEKVQAQDFISTGMLAENIPRPKEKARANLDVLFIGNSYIYTNDLPAVFALLARAAGYTVHAEVSANPGWSLDQHAKSGTTLSMITKKRWDYVVLQEQSVLPIFKADRLQKMLPAARILNKKAKHAGAKTILMMTWGRKAGLPDAGCRDFKDMQAELSKGYAEVANELNAIVAPVGTAWKNVLAIKPFFPLWQEDGSHPSVSGTYLAACVLFSVIYKESPVGIDYKFGLTESTALLLQRAGGSTVLENATQWHVYPVRERSSL